jgi:tellurite resistance protein TerC
MGRGGITYWRDRAGVTKSEDMSSSTTGSASASVVLTLAFTLTVTAMLALDLGVFNRKPREPTFLESIAWTGAWIALACAFGLGVTLHLGPGKGLEFFTAYLLEKALSIDNLFVLLLVFGHFAIPPAGQRRALSAGVVGAFVLRTVLIAGGTSLVARFHVLTYALGALLVVSAVKLARDKQEPKQDEAPESRTERLARMMLPVSTRLDGARFFTREGGMLRVTPLLVAVLVIEVTDVVFAMDSIPAVLGVTTNRFVALTSNLFAVLGLRSLFFVVAGLLARLRHLKVGLALVLLFVGGKMLGSFVFEVPTLASLLVVAAILSGATIASLLYPARTTERTDHHASRP